MHAAASSHEVDSNPCPCPLDFRNVFTRGRNDDIGAAPLQSWLSESPAAQPRLVIYLVMSKRSSVMLYADASLSRVRIFHSGNHAKSLQIGSRRQQHCNCSEKGVCLLRLGLIPTFPYMQIGGLPAFNGHVQKFTGIRNGIDTDIWDPQNDPFLTRPYGPDDVVEGKKAARQALRNALGLTGWEDRPIVGVITRLTAQKGNEQAAHWKLQL